MKKIVIFLLILSFAFSFVGCGSTSYSQGLEFRLEGDEYALVGIGSCKDTTILIPSSYEGLPVTKIAGYAFEDNKKITTIVVPNSIIEFDDLAFNCCYNLVEVNIPNSVKRIGTLAFKDCDSLEKIRIPASVERIGYNAFWSCNALSDIYCQATKKPSGWEGSWNPVKATVHWGA